MLLHVRNTEELPYILTPLLDPDQLKQNVWRWEPDIRVYAELLMGLGYFLVWYENGKTSWSLLFMFTSIKEIYLKLNIF